MIRATTHVDLQNANAVLQASSAGDRAIWLNVAPAALKQATLTDAHSAPRVTHFDGSSSVHSGQQEY